MKSAFVLVVSFSFGVLLGQTSTTAGEKTSESTSQPTTSQLPTSAEARGRAELLHDTVEQLLHVVHQRYYREDEGLKLPAAALKEVFRELAERRGVELRWLAVEAEAMNVAHVPRDDFEKAASKAILAGDSAFEQTVGGTYRRVGRIVLTNECLKCHVPNRTSTRDRAAGLVIAMPVRAE